MGCAILPETVPAVGQVEAPPAALGPTLGDGFVVGGPYHYTLTNTTIAGPLTVAWPATALVTGCRIAKDEKRYSAIVTAASAATATITVRYNALIAQGGGIGNLTTTDTLDWPSAYTTQQAWVWNNTVIGGQVTCTPHEWEMARDAGDVAEYNAALFEQAQQQVWQQWNGQWYAAVEQKALTEEEQRERERQARVRRDAAQQAVEKAKRLFLSVLDAAQRAEFDRTQQFTVRSQSSRRRYLIRAAEHVGRHGNITELDAHGRHVASLCCAPGGNIPHFDAILGQKLALECDEQAFRRAANFTPLVAGYRREAA